MQIAGAVYLAVLRSLNPLLRILYFPIMSFLVCAPNRNEPNLGDFLLSTEIQGYGKRNLTLQMRGAYEQQGQQSGHAIGCVRLCVDVSGMRRTGVLEERRNLNDAEYASTGVADGSENSAEPAAPAAAAAVTTEIAPTAVPGVELRSAIVKELEAMKQRIAELEAELAAGSGATHQTRLKLCKGRRKSYRQVKRLQLCYEVRRPSSSFPGRIPTTVTPPPPVPEKTEPFSDADWTWLNGNPRNKDTAYDSKFFTPEIRADITYNYDFNKPIDDSIGGSSELFRANEVQLEQLGVGGDFHFENVRARFMTQFGAYSTATVRNDPSYAKGQWNLSEADRYPVGSVWRIPYRYVARNQHRCRHIHVLYRPLQLLQLR